MSNPVFILKQDPSVRWPVTVRLPADGGGFVEQVFEAEIRVLPECEYKALIPRVGGERDITDILVENADILPRLVSNWFGVADDTGEVIPITALENILLRTPYGVPLSAGLWRAINEVRFGTDASGGATEKNSVSSPAAGRARAATS
jgi:hypothetical protein